MSRSHEAVAAVSADANLAVAQADLKPGVQTHHQLYARDLKYLAEWTLNSGSTDGSGLSSEMYAKILKKVSSLRKQQGLTDDSRVVTVHHILHGTPGKVFKSLWVEYLQEMGVALPMKYKLEACRAASYGGSCRPGG